MATWRLPSWLTLARTLARGLAWLTDIVAIVVLCFMAQRWTETCGPVAPGIVGSVVALLNDSWQMIAFAGRSLGFQPLRPQKALMHDIFSLAVTMGGMVLMLVSKATQKDAYEDVNYSGENNGGIHFRKSSMAVVAMWLLGAVIVWRVGFGIWACADCYKDHQQEAQRYGRTPHAEVQQA